MKDKSTLVQLFQYGIVGGIAFVADYGSLWSLTEYFNVYYLISAPLAFIIGLSINYILSIKWVFNEKSVEKRWIEFVIFAIIGIVGLGFNELIIFVITEIFSFHYMFGKLASTVLVFFWNFFARKLILFSKVRK